MSQITVDRNTGLTPSPAPEEKPNPTWERIKKLLTPIASLRLTVILFSLSMFLVFVGTLAQVEMGLQTSVDTYFRSAFVWVPLQLFVKFGQVFPIFLFGGLPPSWEVDESIGFPFFGGWLLGGVLLVNLLAAHIVRFKVSWKRSGILLIHAGLVIMMLSELITGLFAVEARMTIAEKETIGFVDELHKTELAVIDPSNPDHDDVIVIPGSRLKKAKGVISDDRLPVDVEVLWYSDNSKLLDEERAAGVEGPVFTSAVGGKFKIQPCEEESGAGSEKSDVPVTRVRFLKKGTGESLGEYTLSLWFYPNTTNRLPVYRFLPQTLTVGEKAYTVELRPRRILKPYAIHLKEFHHDVYVGTGKPKNYASDVVVYDSEQTVRREVKISMNDPLRYRGETFYQSGFLPGNKGTVLQVVENPGWLMPYISCAVVSLGMLIHFGLVLYRFLEVKLPKRTPVEESLAVKSSRNAPAGGMDLNWYMIVPSLVVGLAALTLVLVMTAPGPTKGKLSLDEVGKLPVVADGRIKPLDSVARAQMLIISKRESFKDAQGDSQPAIRWLLDAMVSHLQGAGKGTGWEHEVFRIENDEVLKLLGLKHKPGSLRYSLMEFGPKLGLLQQEGDRAEKVDSKKRNLFEQKVLELGHNVAMYEKLTEWKQPLIIPVGAGERDWKSFQEVWGEARGVAEMIAKRRPEFQKLNEKERLEVIGQLSQRVLNEEYPAAGAWLKMLLAYRDNEPDKFNQAVVDFRKHQGQLPGSAASKASDEYWFNGLSLFTYCFGMYVIVFLLAAIGWIAVSPPLLRSAFWLTIFTFAVHTFALIFRMYIQGRPPVTNLYSSAVFIGWGCVGLGLFLEWIYRNGIGVAKAAILGAATTIIARYLAESKGDTLEMMEAVLDTNFWLATHVTCITLGYSATFFAGFLGLVFVLLGLFTKRLDPNTFRNLGQMMYGVLCFATLLSFVGTVLGGIWADQSWGRFWGWDPKENGALLIVLINALILHARWAGLVKQRGMAVLTLVGNMVVAWSWFGTNQLGVGLHAYGFNNTLALGLSIFWWSMIVCIGMGLIPSRHWTSFGKGQFDDAKEKVRKITAET